MTYHINWAQINTSLSQLTVSFSKYEKQKYTPTNKQALNNILLLDYHQQQSSQKTDTVLPELSLPKQENYWHRNKIQIAFLL